VGTTSTDDGAEAIVAGTCPAGKADSNRVGAAETTDSPDALAIEDWLEAEMTDAGPVIAFDEEVVDQAVKRGCLAVLSVASLVTAVMVAELEVTAEDS
jgi:hypothetical protein